MADTFAQLDENMLVAQPADGLNWYNVQQWGVEGQGFTETEHYFDRLPVAAKGVVREVLWRLSQMSAGLLVRFQTNSTEISVKYRLRFPDIAMNHMPATGVSGIDLYGRNSQGQWRWVGIARPEQQDVQAQIVDGLDGQQRDYMMYLPLYNGVESLEIGVKPDAGFVGQSPRADKPIAFYGTSILQGGCASRPGMAYPAILGRHFDCPTMNLGFSGNGIMEPEVADLLAELDPCVYVLDSIPNMSAEIILERLEPCLHKLRNAHPETPIVLVEDRCYAQASFVAQQRQQNLSRRQAWHQIYGKLINEGFEQLVYVTGDHLFGHDDEATVDGSHATDLGFYRQAQALIPVLTPLVRK